MAGRISANTERALRLHTRDGVSIGQAASMEGVDRTTLYRALRRYKDAGVTQRTVIAGAGALGRELLGWLRLDGRAHDVVFLSDVAVPGLPVLAGFDDYAPQPGDSLLIALADPGQREASAKRLRAPADSYVARSATVGDAQIGPGCLLLPNSLVSASAVLGQGVLVNVLSCIGHDVALGDWCTLSSQVDLMGGVQVGRSVFFGSGSRVVPKMRIGDGATIGAGAVVLCNVPPGETWAGNPARRLA
jgi:sugar O-acyltransferase (sialic acid O-acetyltransferase NeuD family)